MILDFDGDEEWENGVDWEVIDPNEGIEDDEDGTAEVMQSSSQNVESSYVRTTGLSHNIHTTTATMMNNYHSKRNALVKSFTTQFNKGLVQWPNSISNAKKELMPLYVHPSITRARKELDRKNNK